jgi:hypothetical protein
MTPMSASRATHFAVVVALSHFCTAVAENEMVCNNQQSTEHRVVRWNRIFDIYSHSIGMKKLWRRLIGASLWTGAVLEERCVVLGLDLSNAFEPGIRGSKSNNDDDANDLPASPTNLLFIMTDQMRFDALGFVQRRRGDYKDLVSIRTPNIDALAEQGINFETAYCVSPRFVSD